MSDLIQEQAEKCFKILKNAIERKMETKEEHTMKATYNGITGELVKLERKAPIDYSVSSSADHLTMCGPCIVCEKPEEKKNPSISYAYDLTIYDPEKKATVSFASVNLSDVQFSGGEVVFDG